MRARQRFPPPHHSIINSLNITTRRERLTISGFDWWAICLVSHIIVSSAAPGQMACVIQPTVIHSGLWSGTCAEWSYLETLACTASLQVRGTCMNLYFTGDWKSLHARYCCLSPLAVLGCLPLQAVVVFGAICQNLILFWLSLSVFWFALIHHCALGGAEEGRKGSAFPLFCSS